MKSVADVLKADAGGEMTMHDRLQTKCLQKFGLEFDITECYYLLVTIFNIESSGVPSCKAPGTAPKVTYNAEFYSVCSSVERYITQYAVPFLQILCLFGNVINLLIYRLPYFHGSSAVYFLRAKAIANIVFVESRFLEVLHAWLYAFSNSHTNERFEVLYWMTRPFIITVANISGTVSTWMTLYITIETVICVLMPFSFRKYCTRKKTLWLLITSLIVSTALHLIFLCTHEVKTKLMLLDSEPLPLIITTTTTTTTITTTKTTTTTTTMSPDISQMLKDTRVVVRHSGNILASKNAGQQLFGNKNWSTVNTLNSSGYRFNGATVANNCWQLTTSYSMQPISTLLANEIYEKIYYWLQMMASIVLPTLAMLLCSLLIVTQFTFKGLGESFSQRRKCVIRLTVATTLSHLLLEGPALLTFGAVALKGAFVQYHNTEICIMSHANNLLSVINATIPFFVFLACNQQFRQMSAFFLRPNFLDPAHRHKKYSTTLYNLAMPLSLNYFLPKQSTILSLNKKNRRRTFDSVR